MPTLQLISFLYQLVMQTATKPELLKAVAKIEFDRRGNVAREFFDHLKKRGRERSRLKKVFGFVCLSGEPNES